jgi:flagellar protein FliS
MTDTTASANAYLRTKVLGAKPEELRLMLLDGALRFAGQARAGLAAKDYEQSFNGFSQCRDIVMELMTSVRTDLDPELGERVRSLYAFMYSELVEASFERDADRLDKIVELLEFERETWRLACEKLAAERAADPTLGSAETPAPSAGHPSGQPAGRSPLSLQA